LAVRQESTEPFHQFYKVVWQALLIAGIHLGWGRKQLRRKFLDSLSRSLNTPCRQALNKQFQGDIRTSEFDDVVRHLDRMDRIHRDTRNDSGPSFVHALRAELRPSKGMQKNEEASSSGTPKKGAVELTGTRKALAKAGRDKDARIEELEAKLAAATNSVVAAVVPAKSDKKEKPKIYACQYCPKGHSWTTDKCFKNPACTVPMEERVARRERQKPKAKVAAIEVVDAPSGAK
jgi:hypothetical protein